MSAELLATLLEQRDAAVAVYQEFADPILGENRALTEDEETQRSTLRGNYELLDARILEVHADDVKAAALAEARAAAGVVPAPAVVRDEPRTYGEGTNQSYFADLCWLNMPGDAHYTDARARLDAHGLEVSRDAINDPKERARVIRSIRENYRKDEQRTRSAIASLEARRMDVAEMRTGMDTGATLGGAFTTPVYLVSDYAPWRQFGRVFADECNKQDLPDYGMTVYLPHVTGPAGVGTQASQNTGVTETDPTAGYLSANLVTEAGQVIVSQQLLDRAGPGIQFDRIVFDQLQRAYNQQFDSAMLTAALVAAGTVTNTATGSSAYDIWQSLHSDVAKAIQNIESVEGLVFPPTHVFTTSTQWGFNSSLLDTTGRPLAVPSYAGPFNAAAATLAGKENVVPEGDSGYELLSLPVFKDSNIPTTNAGADTQVIVAHMPEVWIWEGPLVPRTIPQTFAQNLSVLLQIYSYNACIVRYPTAVQAITGARYPAAPTFVQA